MHKGSCLCGGVNFTVSGKISHAPEACHCSQCRKQSGHYYAGRNVLKSAPTVSGEDKVAWYQSSEQVRRGFCSICGSSLFWAPLMPDYDYIAIAIAMVGGAFDTPTNSHIAKHTYVGDKGDYYDITNGVGQSEGY